MTNPEIAIIHCENQTRNRHICTQYLAWQALCQRPNQQTVVHQTDLAAVWNKTPECLQREWHQPAESHEIPVYNRHIPRDHFIKTNYRNAEFERQRREDLWRGSRHWRRRDVLGGGCGLTRILVQTECYLYSSPKAGLIAFLGTQNRTQLPLSNNSENAVPRRSRWKRSMHIPYHHL